MTAARADAAAPAVARSSGAPRGRHLVVVEEQVDRPRRVRWGALSLLVLFLAVFGVVVFQALLVQAQGRLDDAERAITVEEARAKHLRLDLAGAESPERIAEAARTRLGMIVPAEQVYLQPEPSDEARAAFDPATQPAPSPTTTTPTAPAAGAAAGGTAGARTSGAATTPTTAKAAAPTTAGTSSSSGKTTASATGGTSSSSGKSTASATAGTSTSSGKSTTPTTAKTSTPTSARGAAR
ncbi:MAG: hypothetical protein R2726_00085 [Acidimicrobiales bacterium]